MLTETRAEGPRGGRCALGRVGRGTRCIALALLVLASASPALDLFAEEAAPAQDDTGQLIEEHALKVVGFYGVLQQVVGPLPALAGTPFLGLTVLSGAALVSDLESVRKSDNALLASFRDNALVAQARRYSSPPVFIALCVLTWLTFMANSGKLQGALGKLIRTSEDWIVAASFAFLGALALSSAGSASQAGPELATMGIVGSSAGVVLAIAIALGLGAMMIVRFACDIIVWLNPIPFVDLAFETGKNVLSLAFLGLYFFSPALAAAIALAVLAASLLALGWALRMLGFGYRVALRPLLARALPSLRVELVSARLAREAGGSPDARVATPMTALSARDLPARQHGVLLVDEIGARFCTTRRWRPQSRPLAGPGERLAIGRTLVWIELRVLGQRDEVRERFALSRDLGRDGDRLRALLGAEDLGELGAARLLRAALPLSQPVSAR